MIKYTNRKKLNSKSNKKTKKNMECMQNVNLKSFEKEYEKKVNQKDLFKTNEKIKKSIVKQLMTPFSPSKITAQNNYYDYINYIWIKDVNLEEQQKYITQVDNFRLVQDKVYGELRDIALDYIKNNNDNISKQMNNYHKALDKYSSPIKSRKLAVDVLNRIDELRKDKNNLWKLLAYANSNETISHRSPFNWVMNNDNKNSKVNRCHILPPTFPIIDLSVYYDDGNNIKYKQKYRNRFNKYCKDLFDTVFEKHDMDTDNIFKVSQELFMSLGCLEVKEDNLSGYNKVTGSEALNKYNFNWNEFSTELGFSSPPPFFICSSLNYLKCCTRLLLNEWNTEKWRPYWAWIFITTIARFTQKWRDINYKFYGLFTEGQEKDYSTLPIGKALYLLLPFNSLISKIYYDKYKNESSIEYINILAQDLKTVFMRIIKRNKWLSNETKEMALVKLKHLKFSIGEKMNLPNDPNLEFDPDDFHDNLIKIFNYRHKQFIQMEGNGDINIPIFDWSKFPAKIVSPQNYIVNASYTPTKNMIYIPLGYIQKPFVDLDERGIEYNLAHCGFTLCHELSHVLDDWGSKYDHNGNLKDWWTSKDKAKFKQIQKDIIKQYEEFAARDGIDFDASIGIGENLADISSLAICEEYLRDFQDKNHDIVPIKSLSFNALYIYFAFQMRQKISKRALRAQLETNPHPLDKYRTNIPLTRSVIFRAINNVKKGDGMYWHTTNTVW